MPRLKAAAPDAAVIVVTGYSDLQGAIAALRQGATDYILKPLNPDVLRTSLGRIAERRQLALAKERSEAAFRHLVEAAECMIVILRPDHTIVYFSPFAEQLTGYSAAEVHGRDYLTLLLPESDRARRRRRSSRGSSPAAPPAASRTRSSAATARAARSSGTHATSPTTRTGPRSSRSATTSRSSSRPRSGPSRPSGWPPSAQMVTGLAHESRNALQRSQACLEMLALAVRDRPEALDLIDRHPEGPGPPPPPLRGRPRLRGPDQARQGRPATCARSGARPGPTSSRPARTSRPSSARRLDGVDLRCAARPVPPRAGLPQHPRQRPGRRLAPGRDRDPRRGGRARRPARAPDRRPRQRPGHRPRAAIEESSTRSTPPRPRGPAWAWPSPSGSSRPTAARSRSATATGPGPIFLITLPRGPP